MIHRRHFLQAAAAAASLGIPVGRAAAAQALTQDQLLAFDPVGQVTLLHLTDLHAQLMPIYFREPSLNLGVGAAKGRPPHLTEAAFREAFAIAAGSPDAYALTAEDFTALAREYGRMGGLDRIATLVSAIRSQRGDGRVLFLDGGDTWHGSWTALQTKGADMAGLMDLLKIDGTTGHFEFTLGAERMKELADARPYKFMAGNVLDEWKEPVFTPWQVIERGGVRIGVVGQAFPFTPVANPRWMVPDWTFGIQEELVRANVAAVRAAGAQLVVLLSHNGYDVDCKLAGRVDGIDVILGGHTHDALPRPTMIARTLVLASGCSGKFLARLDLDVQGGEVKGWRHRLIPVFSDAITPEPAMAAAIEAVRTPYKAELARELGRTEGLLYRRGNLGGTLDDLICTAMLEGRDAEIALSPGFRWGPSLLPNQVIHAEDLYNATAMTYPACYRTPMTGARLREVLEDVADNLFNPDPYYQQGGDMVRVGGIGYALDPAAPMGHRIRDLRLLKTGAPIEASREYQVAGWASVNEGTEGPPIWDVVESWLKRHGTVPSAPAGNVRMVEA